MDARIPVKLSWIAKLGKFEIIEKVYQEFEINFMLLFSLKEPVSDFVCQNASPGIGCGFPEMLVLGILYFVCGLFCFLKFALVLYRSIISKKTQKNEITEQINASTNEISDSPYHLTIFLRNTTVLFGVFWFSMFLWLTYDGIITIVPFDYDIITYRIVYLGIDLILYLIPLSFFVLLILELCFAWRNPGGKIIKFFRVVFGVFLSVFILTGLMLSMVNSEDAEDPSTNLSLWIASTDLLIAIYVLFPALQLIKQVSTPAIQPEDICCVRLSKIGTFCFFLVFLSRFAFNLCRYLSLDFLGNLANDLDGKNDLQLSNHYSTTVLNAINENLKATPTVGKYLRIYKFFQGFIFNFGAAILVIIGTYILETYDFRFLDETTYIRAQNSVIPS